MKKKTFSLKVKSPFKWGSKPEQPAAAVEDPADPTTAPIAPASNATPATP